MFVFSMPLFFFLSGYLFNPHVEMKRYFEKKCICLLVPYVVFLVLLFIIPQTVAAYRTSGFDAGAIRRIIIPVMLGGRELQGVCGVFWFVSCLFFTQQTANALMLRYSNSTLLWIFGSMLALSCAHSLYFRQYWLPLNLNVVLASAPIFYAGYLFRRAENGLVLRVLAVMASIAAVAASGAGIDISCDMKAAIYGVPAITFVSALAVVISLIGIAKRMEKIPVLTELFGALGRASMVIMFLHQTLLIHSRSYFGPNQEIVRFGFSVFVSYAAYELISRISVARALLLGSEPEFKKLFIKMEITKTNRATPGLS